MRLSRGWTQTELARRSGVSRQTIYRLEVGRIKSPGRDTVAKLADALGIEESALEVNVVKVPRKMKTGTAHAVVPFKERKGRGR